MHILLRQFCEEPRPEYVKFAFAGHRTEVPRCGRADLVQLDEALPFGGLAVEVSGCLVVVTLLVGAEERNGARHEFISLFSHEVR